MKERWFNYRPLCLIFGFLLLGSVFAFYIKQELTLTISVSLTILISLIVLAILKKKPQYALVPIIAFGVGIGLYFIGIARFNSTIDYTPNTIQARVYSISNEVDGMVAVEADSCKFDNKNSNDNLVIYIYDNSGLFKNINVGSIIKFKPYKFYKTDLFYNKTPNANRYYSDLKYTAIVIHEDIEYIKTDKTFAENIKTKVKNNLEVGLTNENAEIAYSALFGDKDLLSDKQYNSYKLSGVAHLLAVSGLHVGIVVTILNFILEKFKIKNWYKLSIIASILLFYSYLCSFTVSALRASIMAIILLLSKILKQPYDSFNSISIAGIIIFLLNPFCIFDVSFLLSFSCVIGITMLYKPLRKCLSTTKMPKTIVDSVAISLATTISIVFIMAYYFRTLNVISIISNVILIPIFTLAFVAIFIISILSLLIPFIKISYLLFPINYVLDFINIIATVLGNLTISNFNTLQFNYIAIIIYFMLLLFLGRFCTAKYQYKIISTLPMVALLLICLL